MQKIEQDKLFTRLNREYFSDPSRLLWLKKGDLLMREGAHNSRLYLVKSGTLIGYVENSDGGRDEVLRAAVNNFIGVYSFFSRTYKSLATIEALSDCELAYIDKNTPVNPDSVCIEKEFMPVAVTDLMNRQTRLNEVSREKHQTLKKLMENQKLASLGQMAAGIAHELNNSIAVLAHNSQWLANQLSMRIDDPMEAAVFETGLIKGRHLSSREVRQAKNEIRQSYPDLCDDCIQNLSQMGLPAAMVSKIIVLTQTEQNQLFNSWETAVALHDMQMAGEQSAHVVKSVKTLGNQNRDRQQGVDVNNTIQNALTLLRHRTRNVALDLQLNLLPEISANSGELIQVWTNLIKNSCEAMLEGGTESPRLGIYSNLTDNQLQIKISDNGPGIPANIFSKIFQPDVTTKVSGLSFGLGLGLTIVQRIVHGYGGRIDVKTSTNGTSFTVYIPLGGTHE